MKKAIEMISDSSADTFDYTYTDYGISANEDSYDSIGTYDSRASPSSAMSFKRFTHFLRAPEVPQEYELLVG